jgi:uracil-DNA glycosylase
VLLLNTYLTVEKSIPGAHKESGWQDFTDAVLDLVNKECKNIVFLFWGDKSKVYAPKLKGSSRKLFIIIDD